MVNYTCIYTCMLLIWFRHTLISIVTVNMGVEERSQQYNFFSCEIFHLYRHHQTLLFCTMYYTTMYYILYTIYCIHGCVIVFRLFEPFNACISPLLADCASVRHVLHSHWRPVIELLQCSCNDTLNMHGESIKLLQCSCKDTLNMHGESTEQLQCSCNDTLNMHGESTELLQCSCNDTLSMHGESIKLLQCSCNDTLNMHGESIKLLQCSCNDTLNMHGESTELLQCSCNDTLNMHGESTELLQCSCNDTLNMYGESTVQLQCSCNDTPNMHGEFKHCKLKCIIKITNEAMTYSLGVTLDIKECWYISCIVSCIYM